MVSRSIRKVGSAISDSIRRTFSTKKWEHKEQLHSLTETNKFFLRKVRWQMSIMAHIGFAIAFGITLRGYPLTNKFFLRKVRWQMSIMAHIGFAIAFGIRSNFGVAKNRMVNNFTDAYGYIHEQEFFWTPTELGMMESSFFYGYAASQIPAGVLAAKFAPNKLFCLGVFVASVLNVVVAFGLQFHPFSDFAVMALQVVQGLALGVTYPAMHGVWRHWAPPLERSKLATTTFTGSYVGVMVGLPVSAALVSYLHWSAPFYVFGAVGVVWSFAWWFVSSRSPLDHSYISEEEKTFISEKIGTVVTGDMTLTTVPWKSILLSPPVWAIVICNFCRSWTFFLLLGNQLTYMKDVLHIDIRNSGLISMLPQLLMAIVVLVSGQLADYFRSTGKMETGNVRKVFNTLGFGGEAIFLCILAFVDEPAPAVTCLVIAATLSGMSVAGFNVNHFDIAPRYASILMGFSNGFGALAGMGGFITQNLTADNPSGWRWCFLLAMGVDLFGIIFYLIFAKGEVQEWAREPEPEETMGEFVRRISTMVRNATSSGRRTLSRTRTRKDSQDYERMDESRNNSAEMKAKKKELPVLNETAFNGSEEPRAAENSLQPDRPANKFFLRKVRWQMSIMAHIGFAIAFGIRSNFGVAKNRMVNNFTDAYGYIHEQEFFWTPTELGMMESSFFYGYAASQIPAGVLAAKFAPNKLFCLGVFVASVLNVVVAFGLQFHPFSDFAVMALQVVQGLALGVTYPAMHGVWRHWAPPLERSKLATTTFTGSYVGVMVGLPVSAALVSYLHWSAPFYVFGAVGVVWSFAWWFVSSRSPLDHSYISEEEKTFISEKIGTVVTGDMTLTTVPWKSILLSPPVWAIVICNFCRSWTFFLLLGNQLTYMKDVLHIDIRNSGLISMLPQLLMAIVVLVSGQLADYFRSTGKMETGNVRKVFNTLGFGGEAIFLCILAFVDEPAPAVTCLVIAATLSGMSVAGFNVNHFDIAPRYASILMGFSNGFGALAGMGGFITQNLTADNPSGWRWCFLLAMGVDLFGIIFYLIFAKGEVQEWAREPEPEETMGEFVRRISTMVRNATSSGRRTLSRTRTRKDSQDYERMDESRNNSAEMKAKKKELPVLNETAFNGSEEPRAAENSLQPDRPAV